MASLLDVSLWPAESVYQKIAQTLLGPSEIVRRIHFPEDVVLRNLPVKRADQTRKSLFANR